MPDKEKRLHGNRAKIAPGKHVEGMFVTSAAALSSARAVQSDDEMEEEVEYAREFVKENKK